MTNNYLSTGPWQASEMGEKEQSCYTGLGTWTSVEARSEYQQHGTQQAT